MAAVIDFGDKHSVRVMGGSMVALDLFTVLSQDKNRKKASQTLTRLASKTEFSALFSIDATKNRKKKKQLISFSNAIQLLLMLPKRTADLQTRRNTAETLVAFFTKQDSSST
jgi:hypothetical protein